jgi:hypothetical protein
MTTVQDNLGQLHRVAERLAQRPWFAAGWCTEIYAWPTESPPEYAMFQLSKPTWFNAQRQGIHLETWLGPEERTSGRLPLELHILHVNAFPGTRHRRAALMRPLMERAAPLARTWTAYEISRNTMRPLRGRVSYRADGVEETLLREFDRLQVLGAMIDDLLADITPS